MDKRMIRSAWLLAAGAIFALSATVLNSCSSDEDYDMYMGDELSTHAAATRSATPEPGTAGRMIYNSKTLKANKVLFSFHGDMDDQECSFDYLVSTSGDFVTFSVSVNNLNKTNSSIGTITGKVTNVTSGSGPNTYKLTVQFNAPSIMDSSLIGVCILNVEVSKSDFTISYM